MSIIIEKDYGIKGNDLLLCTSCGGGCLHQKKVEVFDCDEGNEIGIHAIVNEKSIKTDRNCKGTPGTNGRSGVIIMFECEMCSNVTELIIKQHKGETHINSY